MFSEHPNSILLGKCPKISYTKVSDKMTYANSADPDQTPEGAVWSGSSLFAIPLNVVSNNYIQQNLGNVWNKVFQILGHLPYFS